MDHSTSDFDYFLPEELIAQHPSEKRDCSRLMTLDKKNGATGHHLFRDIAGILRPGDCLVLNDSRVLPARLFGVRPDGGAVEALLLRDTGEGVWECLVKPGRRIRTGARLSFGEGALFGEVVGHSPEGNRLIRFECKGLFLEALDTLGEMPLPPYIKERLEERERYQTVYAKHPGSAAAPTAGLHFTQELLDELGARRVACAYLTLHIGLGTFRPVKAERISEHHMHSELCIVSEKAADTVNAARARGGRIVAVGTTSCRTLESMADENGLLRPGSRWTDLFIYPGYTFRMTDALITNFHLPKSTLIMLVSALAGRENVLAAYREAVDMRYRFFSFGDAMMIV